ncbi:hypothetical protein B0H63DRAFT_520443 [Podospora didyma]|uniref:Uncharacterized protein n=1 Tax=Podospora didyma TaxID=330526 RepID=A0AAE0U527_9PEZI|nr:hypothetical protein B0H63DRAFT_520443 [Podospora didyma]
MRSAKRPMGSSVRGQSRILMRYAASEQKLDDISRALELGCTKDESGGCHVKNDFLWRTLGRVSSRKEYDTKFILRLSKLEIASPNSFSANHQILTLYPVPNNINDIMIHSMQNPEKPALSPPTRLVTPFPSSHSTCSLDACFANLPASLTWRRTTSPPCDMNLYLASELQTWKLDRIARHLWYAGLKGTPARSLHRHRLSRRGVVVTESSQRAPALHAAACGILLSYTWLVAYPSDFDLAKERRLLPEDMNDVNELDGFRRVVSGRALAVRRLAGATPTASCA